MIRDSIKGKILSDVSFITTVYNEEESIVEFLESLMSQTHLPGEIIIVDGGSRDCTFEKILGFFKISKPRNKEESETALESLGKEGKIKIKAALVGVEDEVKKDEVKTVIKNDDGVINVIVMKKIGANISQGRNEAIKKASGKIICVSDAGCILDKNWMLEITRFHDDTSCVAVGGLNKPYCKNFIQKCLAVCIMPLREEIKAEKYMPSSRNISFKKKIWSDVSGYPENMDYGEDMKFNFYIKNAGYRIKFNPDAIVFWKMRENLIQISQQFFRYAKGDAMGKMYLYRHIIRFIVFLMLVAILVSAFCISGWILFILVPLFIAYIYKSYNRLVKSFVNKDSCCFYGREKFFSIFFIPLLLLQIDFSKMCGYTFGLFKSN